MVYFRLLLFIILSNALASKSITLTFVPQHNSYTCWAACAQMILGAYGHAYQNNSSEVPLVQYAACGRSDCPGGLITRACPYFYCTQTSCKTAIGGLLRELGGIPNSSYSYSLSFDQIKTIIDADKLIIAGLRNPTTGGIGHAVVIYGYEDAGSILVADPEDNSGQYYSVSDLNYYGSSLLQWKSTMVTNRSTLSVAQFENVDWTVYGYTITNLVMGSDDLFTSSTPCMPFAPNGSSCRPIDGCGENVHNTGSPLWYGWLIKATNSMSLGTYTFSSTSFSRKSDPYSFGLNSITEPGEYLLTMNCRASVCDDEGVCDRNGVGQKGLNSISDGLAQLTLTGTTTDNSFSTTGIITGRAISNGQPICAPFTCDNYGNPINKVFTTQLAIGNPAGAGFALSMLECSQLSNHGSIGFSLHSFSISYLRPVAVLNLLNLALSGSITKTYKARTTINISGNSSIGSGITANFYAPLMSISGNFSISSGASVSITAMPNVSKAREITSSDSNINFKIDSTSSDTAPKNMVNIEKEYPFVMSIQPNPSNPSTQISYFIPKNDKIFNGEIAIYDVSGKVVRSINTLSISYGKHIAVWDGKDNKGNYLPSSTYIVTLNLNGLYKQAKRVVLVK